VVSGLAQAPHISNLSRFHGPQVNEGAARTSLPGCKCWRHSYSPAKYIIDDDRSLAEFYKCLIRLALQARGYCYDIFKIFYLIT
jgi:hypothetical protein